MSPLLKNWVDMLVEVRLPVLAHTVTELEHLQLDEDAATPQRVADIVLHDPMMTVKVLQFLQQHRSRHFGADITTIAHALMMLGTAPFLSSFRAETSIEDRLTRDTAAFAGVQQVMSRARQAALYARDWAQFRHDIDPEEVMIAALLRNLAEMVLWCYAPALALEIAERQDADPTLRSGVAQRGVIGFRLLDLQLELVRAWQLPELLHTLMEETRTHNPRARNVALATAVARHSAHGWCNPALPEDYAQIAELLDLSVEDVMARIAAVALQGAAESQWYGVTPLAPFAPPACLIAGAPHDPEIQG